MTHSEKLFDRYLQQLGYKRDIDYDVEFSINGNPPVDFCIHKFNPKILVEIKEFNPYIKGSKRSKQFKEDMGYDGYGLEDIRKKISDIGLQFKPYKNNPDYVCIGVIQEYPPFLAFKANYIAEAMYGNLDVNIISLFPEKKFSWEFTGVSASTHSEKNTRISAICSLTSAEDNSDILQDGNVIKCICVLNYFSTNKIQPYFFSGQRDEVWEINNESKLLKQIPR